MNLPAFFVSNIHNTFGSEGVTFLQNLPKTVQEYADRWRLALKPAFHNLSYNYVAPGIDGDGREIVLKLGVPHRELWSEIEALTFYAGRGSVRLLAAEPACGAMLLERLRPGEMLRGVVEEDDACATAIIAEVMAALWRPAPAAHSMLTIATWAQELAALRTTFDGGCGPFPAHLVDIAERLFDELLASSAAPVVLHGDLHHENILSTYNTEDKIGWLVIDPKGVVGEREFEVYALLRNPHNWPLAQPDPSRVLRRRLDQVADRLSLDRERMRLWSVAQCVLSAWWDYTEDAGSSYGATNSDLQIAEILWKMC